MAKNQNTGMMRKAFIMFAALGSIFSSGMGRATANQTNNRDAIVSEAKPVSGPIAERRVSGKSASSFSGKRGILNQRQYRKKCRQNPSLYKSKKHRSKN